MHRQVQRDLQQEQANSAALFKDVLFFKKDTKGVYASEEVLLSADTVMLMLENQKNEWIGFCVSHHLNGEEYYDPVKVVVRRYILRQHTQEKGTFISVHLRMVNIVM